MLTNNAKEVLCLYFEGKVSYKSFWCSHAVNKPGWGVCASAEKQ